MVYQQLATPIPQIAQNGWVLHGRVYDESNQPASGFTVFLMDDKEAYQPAYGFAYTDASGYFQLNYAGPDTTSQAKPTTDTKAVPTPQLFVQVLNTKAQPVYPKTTPFQPAIGAALYQNLNLTSKEPLGNPRHRFEA